VGESDALLEACQDLLAIAPTRFPALISGESGVGKELAARAIHELSDRAQATFETLDCGSIPRELIESELFGHVRGAFTGAHRDRRGLFEIAHRGTLFLDEIGEMPLQLQTRLLRVIQEGRLRRVGDETPIEVDVRVVAATHRELKREVAEGRFREDLFYRLNVFTVNLPPLRDRIGDLEPLVAHFLRRQGRELGIAEWDVAPEVVGALAAHRWPGNVRELGNLCAALAVRGRQDGAIGLDELNAVWRRQHPGETPPWTGAASAPRDQLGAWVIEQARAARFNLVEAARQLARRKQRGQAVPLTERSALTYYLTGEILRALAECAGDEAGAARQLAGDDDLAARVAARVRKIADVVREARGDRRALRRTFAKLPAGYEAAAMRRG
jgi:transcriptional regulator with GAF, ATPase, and Fis domain